MVSGWIIAALLAACSLGEWLHARRSARLAHLAFGPAGRPRAWVSAAAPVRVLAVGLLGWGLLVLLAADRAPWEAGSAAAAKPAAVAPPGHRPGRLAEHATARRGAVGHATAGRTGPRGPPLDPRRGSTCGGCA